MKQCISCKEIFNIKQFYVHPRMADGRLNKCKECCKRDVKKNYWRKIKQYREYERERSQRPERKAKLIEYQRKRRRKYPEKDRARAAVARAIERGNLIRMPCEICGEKKSEAHHDDYAKHLDVRWLCLKHHREAHGQIVI